MRKSTWSSSEAYLRPPYDLIIGCTVFRKRVPPENGINSGSSSAEGSSAEDEEEDTGLESDAEDLAGVWDDADEATCVSSP